MKNASKAKPSPVTTHLDWMPVDLELPDDDITVLLAADDGEVYLGAHDGSIDGWLFETLSEPNIGVKITHWAHATTPQAPTP